MGSDLDRARAQFDKARYGLPPVPTALEADFRRRDEWVYSSRPILISPYDYRDYLELMRQPEVPSFVIVGHAGHGVNSYALSYYLVWNELRLLFQLPLGGVYMDEQQTTDNVRKTFALLREHWPALERRFARPTGEGVCLLSWSGFWGGLELCGGEERELTREERAEIHDGNLQHLDKALLRFSTPKKEG